MSVVVVAVLTAGCATTIGTMYSRAATDDVAPLNPDSGRKTVRVHAKVDPGLQVLLRVSYYPANFHTKLPGCFYTANWFEGATFPRYRARTFPLKDGTNSLIVPVDEILPGACEFKMSGISFDIADAKTGAKAASGGTLIAVADTGGTTRPHEVINCRANRQAANPTLYCTAEWTRLRSESERRAAANLMHQPVKSYGGEVSLEFQLGALLGQTNPSLQTGPAAGGRPVELQR
jgi:hypothetical protein